MKHLLHIALILIALVACNGKSDDVLSSKKMEKVLYDYHLAQAMISNLHGDSAEALGRQYIEAVFSKHNITEAQFDSSIVYYNRHANDLKKIYAHLDERFSKENEESQYATGNNDMIIVSGEGGDTTNIWSGKTFMLLRSKDILSTESFTIKADTSFHRHDQFILTLTPSFFKEQTEVRDITLNIGLTIRYRNGKESSMTRQITNSGRQQYTLKATEDSDIESIVGYFFYYGKNYIRNFCIVDNIGLIRMHVKEEKAEKAEEIELKDEKSDSIIRDTLMPIPARRFTPEERRLENRSGKRLKIEQAPAVRQPNKPLQTSPKGRKR